MSQEIVLSFDLLRLILVTYSFAVNWYTVLLTLEDRIVAADRGVNGGIAIILAQFLRTRLIISLIVSSQALNTYFIWGRNFGWTVSIVAVFGCALFAWLGTMVIVDRLRLKPYILPKSGSNPAQTSFT